MKLDQGGEGTISCQQDPNLLYNPFIRILGFYVSGFVMIAISFDRLSAILYPLAHRANARRTRWQYDGRLSKAL